jgi:hypothetical protein
MVTHGLTGPDDLTDIAQATPSCLVERIGVDDVPSNTRSGAAPNLALIGGDPVSVTLATVVRAPP